MDTAIQLLIDNPLLLLFVVAAIGYPLGQVSIRGSRLGVAAVLFAGLGVGALHPGPEASGDGVQPGPGAVRLHHRPQQRSGLLQVPERNGAEYNLLVLAMILVSAAAALAAHSFSIWGRCDGRDVRGQPHQHPCPGGPDRVPEGVPRAARPTAHRAGDRLLNYLPHGCRGDDTVHSRGPAALEGRLRRGGRGAPAVRHHQASPRPHHLRDPAGVDGRADQCVDQAAGMGRGVRAVAAKWRGGSGGRGEPTGEGRSG